MRKLQIRTNKENQSVLFELEIEKDGEGYKTSYIHRFRLATSKEVLLFNSGLGRMISFENESN